MIGRILFLIRSLIFRKAYVWIKDDEHNVKRARVTKTPFGPVATNPYRSGLSLLEKDGRVKVGSYSYGTWKPANKSAENLFPAEES